MILEDRYLVLKREDIEDALNDDEQAKLAVLIAIVRGKRFARGKKDNRYVVINQDEPYFPDVLKLMEKEQEG